MSHDASSMRVLLPSRIQPPDLPAGAVVASFSGACMGTGWSVRCVSEDSLLSARARQEVPALLEQLEAQMSHFREHSDLRRFGRHAAGEWMQLPPAFASVMRAALEVAQASEGAFDPALGAEVDAWGFGSARHFSDPAFSPPAEGRRPPRAAWSALRLDEAGRLFQPGDVQLNLSAIAKGFAVDAVSALLSRLGLHNHLVEVGGELRGAGMKPDFQPWWVALELPARDCPLPATRIALHGLAVATSGDYRRRYHHDGRALQHTLDPATGAPLTHGTASVTVLHEQCMLADAWATALMVRGPDAGLTLAEEHKLCALIQWRNNKDEWVEAASSAFTALQQSS
ncbi:FAD:protein FMN transferase [Uliginosibacterium paludis]|uniref:FAD:protein FMN transferase n=1 Tax=Uliginosibacterium paludis TaxID=1615952 RepID=A0ABV2CL06_9RHOO